MLNAPSTASARTQCGQCGERFPSLDALRSHGVGPEFVCPHYETIRAAWPADGWKHALNAQQFRSGDIFGWVENQRLWSGRVEEVCRTAVRVVAILPGQLASPALGKRRA
jgi:hypothetical protein